MYLKSIDLQMFDAKSGNLLVEGHWQNSVMHSFPDPAGVMHELVPDMLAKIKSTALDNKTAAVKQFASSESFRKQSPTVSASEP
jgi:hypothetical protein